MFGIFEIVSLKGSDKAGFETSVDVRNCMDAGIEGELFLPPYLRPGQCDLKVGSKVVGFLDDVSGMGAAIVGVGSADWGYRVDADVNVRGTLTASVDVKGGGISLKTHTHSATLAVTGVSDPVTNAVEGSASGSVDVPK